MISAKQFLAILKQRDLLPADLIAKWEKEVEQAGKPISARVVANRLIELEYLTPAMADRLLGSAEPPAGSLQPAASEPPPSPTASRRPASADEELGLAPLEDELAGPLPGKPSAKSPARPPERGGAAPGRAGPRPVPPGEESPEELEPIEELEPLEQLEPIEELEPSEELEPLEELEPIEEPKPARPPARKAAPPPSEVTLPPLPTIAVPAPPPAQPAAPVKGRRFRRRKNVWESTLLLVGGGGLLLLVILLVVLLWAVRRQGADELLKLAEDDYHSGSYTQAIAKYDEFLKRFAQHPSASMVRVHRGLAQLRQASDTSGNWPKALEVAKQILGEIAQEKVFRDEAKNELIAILPKIAEGLAQQAHQRLDAGLVQQAQDALAVVSKYILPADRPLQRINDIESLLALTTHEIASGEQLRLTIGTMERLVSEGKPAEAYIARRELLKAYPRLADNQQLRAAVIKVAQAELGTIEKVDRSQKAVAVEEPTAALASVALAQRTTQSAVEALQGHTLVVAADGVAYGLAASDGRVLWRRPVGFDVQTQGAPFPPTPIDKQPGSDILMVNRSSLELLRVEAGTGRMRWRFPVGEPFDAHPALADGQALVAARSGKIVWVDLQSGDSNGYLQMPQPLRVCPAIDSARDRLYQVMEHSTLFVVSLSRREPQQVVYLGHEPGTVVVPPAVVHQYLLVAVNDQVRSATLHVLATDSKGDDGPVAPVHTVSLRGHVDTPICVSGNRVLVVTTQGGMYVFEIQGANEEKPLAMVAQSAVANEQAAAGDELLLRFPLLHGGQVWIADSQLTRYELQPSKGRLQPQGFRNEQSVTLQPLAALGSTVFHLHKRKSLPGLIVSAFSTSELKLLWESRLGCPLCSEPQWDEGQSRLTAVTRAGAIFQLDLMSLEGGQVRDEPILALDPAELSAPVSNMCRLEGAALLLVRGDTVGRLPIFDPSDQVRRFRWLFLAEPPTATPAVWNAGLLVPGRGGQVLWIDPRSGHQKAEPFQPPIVAGAKMQWSRPVPLPDHASFAIVQGNKKLFRVQLVEQPKPHLAAAAEAELVEALSAGPALAGSTLVAVDSAGSLVAFQLPGLQRIDPQPLGGRCVWGPISLGNLALLATDDEQLLCIAADGSIAWRSALPYGSPVGSPALADNMVGLASASGTVWWLNTADGKEQAKAEVKQPLGTGPVLLGKQWVVAGHDGTLYRIEYP